MEDDTQKTSLKNQYNISTANMGLPTFTQREIEVLQHIAIGESNKTIAEKLCLSIKSVEHYVNCIFQKVDFPRWAHRRVWLAVNIKNILEGINKGGK